MGLFKTYLQFWLKVFDFKGRSSRREFWIPTLINYTGPIILMIISYCLKPFPLNWKMTLIHIITNIKINQIMTGSQPLSLAGHNSPSFSVLNAILLILIGLIIISNLSIMIRRIRDTGFNPILVIIIYIVLLFVNVIIGLVFIPIILLMPTSSSSSKASKFYNYNNYDDDEWTDQ